tara:strand:+ start:469 stop:1659 length:1191 start_codon:yes stop_codon:yes gene_type:complete
MKTNKNKEKKNILFYCPFIERGGIRTTLIKYANFLSEKYNVKIFTETTDSFQLSKFNKKIEIYQPKKTFKITKKFRLLEIFGISIGKDDNDKDVTIFRIIKDAFVFWRLREELLNRRKKNEWKGESIIFSMSDHFVPLVLNKLTLNSKMIIRTAGIVPNRYNKEEYKHMKNLIIKKILIRFYRLANIVVTFSSQNVKYFESLGIKACCIYNNFEKQKVVKNFKKNKKLNIFFVGRFSYEKNVDFFFQNLKNYSNINIHLVGDGEYKPELKKAAFGKKNVFFHGFVKNPFRKFLNKMDLLSINSKFDGTPNVMGEAMSYGIPVIAPKNVGLTNLFIGNDKYGYLYKSEDGRSFKKKINSIIRNYRAAFEKAKKAYKSISRFSKKNTHYKIIAEIEKL